MWDWSGSNGGAAKYKPRRVDNQTPSPTAYPNGYNAGASGWGNQQFAQQPMPQPMPQQPHYQGGYAPPPPQQAVQQQQAPNYGYHQQQPPAGYPVGGYPQQPQPQQAYGPQPYPPAPQPSRYNMPPSGGNYPPNNYAPQPQGYHGQQPAMMPTHNDSHDLSLWEWQVDNFNLPNMELQEAMYVMQSPKWKTEMKKAFKRARRDFLKFVGYHHVEECKKAGVTEEGLKLLKRGRSPENFNVHMKIPLDYLGTNDFSNLCLIKGYPYHNEIHKFLDLQIRQSPLGKPKQLLIPVPRGKVYVPEEAAGSFGGKDKHDRSVYAGFLESTFEIIKLKSSMGRASD